MTASGPHCASCGADFSVGVNFCRECGKQLNSTRTAKPGYYAGKHYTKYVDDVKNLMKENKLEDAEKLLLALINATENESQSENCGVAPWYYERLAVIYRKKKETKSELQILERYEGQKHAPGSLPPKLIARLEKMRSRQSCE